MNNKRSRTQQTRAKVKLITVKSGCLGQWRSEGGLRDGRNRREVIECRPSAIEPRTHFVSGQKQTAPSGSPSPPPPPPPILFAELNILYPPLVRIAQRKSWRAPLVHNLCPRRTTITLRPVAPSRYVNSRPVQAMNY